MTDEKYAEILAFAVEQAGRQGKPVEVLICLPELDEPRLIPYDPDGAAHLKEADIYLSPQDGNDFHRRIYLGLSMGEPRR